MGSFRTNGLSNITLEIGAQIIMTRDKPIIRFSENGSASSGSDTTSETVIAEFIGDLYNHGAEFQVISGDVIELPLGLFQQLVHDFPTDWREIKRSDRKAKPIAGRPRKVIETPSAEMPSDKERRAMYEPSRWARNCAPEDIDVSIVSGTWNRLPHLKRMVESVRRKIEAKYEFVIVDGGSNDGTLDWLMRQDDVTLVRQPKLLGACSAFNNGFAYARGRYCVNFNDDIEAKPGAVDTMYRFMEENDQVAQGVFYYAIRDGKYHINVIGGRPYANFGMTRKHLGDLVGWWGYEYYTYGGDTELSMQLHDRGCKVEGVPQAKIVDHQVEDELRQINHSETLIGENGHRDTEQFWEKWKGRIEGQLRLHVGCGHKKLKGWVNVDSDPTCDPNRIEDVTELRSFPDGGVAEIYACHVLEHVPPYDTQRTLRRWFTLLRPGGVLRLAVPDLRLVMKNRVDSVEDGPYFNAAIHGVWNRPSEDPHWIEKVHKQSFVRESLEAAMSEAGFKAVGTWDMADAPEIAALGDFASCELVTLNLVGTKPEK